MENNNIPPYKLAKMSEVTKKITLGRTDDNGGH